MARSRLDDLDHGYEELSASGFSQSAGLPDPTAGAATQGPEGQGTWAYLALLGLLFVALVGFSFACDDRTPSATGMAASVGNAADVGGSARVLVDIDRAVVTVDGSVPDEATRDAVINAAASQYGPENVIDGLTVDPTVTLDDGVLTIAGRADVGDDRPADLEQALEGALDLSMSSVAVNRIEAGQLPAELTASIDGDRVHLAGVVPDAETQNALIEAARTVWGVANVDDSGLTVGETTLSGGSLAVAGSALPGDERSVQFEEQVRSQLGTELQVELRISSSIDASVLAELEGQIKDVVTEQPILFQPRSAEIDATSDAVLQRVAELLQEIPDVPVEIVGHTDSEGVEAENLELSKQRAAAVVVRLEDLGIDPDRLSSRGEGQTQPIASNDTPETRALNRRIEFLVVGAS